MAVRALDVDDHDAVFRVFAELADELGGLDRVIVNAGLGKGAPIGTGRFDVNRQTVTTNSCPALAQCEAAMEIFRAAGAGHLVVVSSMSALRGLPRSMAAYAASKAGIAAVAEGLRAELVGGDIVVTTLFPGYIESEMNERVAQTHAADGGDGAGVRAMVRAIEREAATPRCRPGRGGRCRSVIRHAPLRLLRKFA